MPDFYNYVVSIWSDLLGGGMRPYIGGVDVGGRTPDGDTPKPMGGGGGRGGGEGRGLPALSMVLKASGCNPRNVLLPGHKFNLVTFHFFSVANFVIQSWNMPVSATILYTSRNKSKR